jgi:hypothetical protein
MRLQHRNLSKLILVAAGLLVLPGLALGAGPDAAAGGASEGNAPPAAWTIVDSADGWLSGLITGWVPGWLQGWLGDDPTDIEIPRERGLGLDRSLETDGSDEPRVGGVDDPAGPWA